VMVNEYGREIKVRRSGTKDYITIQKGEAGALATELDDQFVVEDMNSIEIDRIDCKLENKAKKWTDNSKYQYWIQWEVVNRNINHRKQVNNVQKLPPKPAQNKPMNNGQNNIQKPPPKPAQNNIQKLPPKPAPINNPMNNGQRNLIQNNRGPLNPAAVVPPPRRPNPAAVVPPPRRPNPAQAIPRQMNRGAGPRNRPFSSNPYAYPQARRGGPMSGNTPFGNSALGRTHHPVNPVNHHANPSIYQREPNYTDITSRMNDLTVDSNEYDENTPEDFTTNNIDDELTSRMNDLTVDSNEYYENTPEDFAINNIDELDSDFYQQQDFGDPFYEQLYEPSYQESEFNQGDQYDY